VRCLCHVRQKRPRPSEDEFQTSVQYTRCGDHHILVTERADVHASPHNLQGEGHRALDQRDDLLSLGGPVSRFLALFGINDLQCDVCCSSRVRDEGSGGVCEGTERCVEGRPAVRRSMTFHYSVRTSHVVRCDNTNAVGLKVRLCHRDSATYHDLCEGENPEDLVNLILLRFLKAVVVSRAACGRR
jgi:hypothetical protein